MPSLDALPVNLHASIGLLSSLAFVKGVIWGIDPYYNKMVINIAFIDGHKAQMRTTLNFFKDCKAEYMCMKDDYMQLVVSGTLIAA